MQAFLPLGVLQHTPTAMEQKADPAHLQIIRDMYGSRAQTLINALLAFDALLALVLSSEAQHMLCCLLDLVEGWGMRLRSWRVGRSVL